MIKRLFGLGSIAGLIIAILLLGIAESNGWGLLALVIKAYIILSLIFLVVLLALFIIPFFFVFRALHKGGKDEGYIDARYKVR